MNWTAEMEQTLLSAIIQYKPIGMHKHFRFINIQRYFSNHSGIHLPLFDLKEKLKDFYDLEALEEDLDDQDLSEYEFSLPELDFESIIEEYRQVSEEDVSREVSPSRSQIKKEIYNKKRLRVRDLKKKKK